MVSDGEEKWEVSQLQFTEDTVLVADSKKKLKSLAEKFVRIGRRRRKLKINVAKSKVLQSFRYDLTGEIIMDG